MYKTVYQEKHGRLTIRERSYSLTLFEGNYCEADPLPVPIERIRPLQAKNRLSEFVRDYLAEHPNADLFDRLTKIA